MNGMRGFGAVLLLRSALYLLVGFSIIPPAWIGTVNVLVSILFVGLPIIGLYFGASVSWKIHQWILFALAGFAIQFGLNALVRPHFALLQGIVFAISQAGLIVLVPWSGRLSCFVFPR